VGASFKIITTDTAGPFPESKSRINTQTVMDYFTKWPEVYTIPVQGASTVADILVTNTTGR
jgi:hypothetical protein